MQIILLQDVKGVGKKGNIVEVSSGYANNYLIPRKLAVMKTDYSMNVLEKQKEDARLEVERKIEEAKATSEKLKSIVLKFEVNTGSDGRMFGAISLKQIEDSLKNEYSIAIDKRKFINPIPVNALGFTRLEIELAKGIKGVVVIEVKEKKK